MYMYVNYLTLGQFIPRDIFWSGGAVKAGDEDYALMSCHELFGYLKAIRTLK